MTTTTQKAYETMNQVQKETTKKCLEKKKCGLSAPLGSGKTLMSLYLVSTSYDESGVPGLVVCAKNLVAGWISEIKKWFGDEDGSCSYKYQVLHRDSIKGGHIDKFKIDPETRLVLTTPDVVSKAFTAFGIEDLCYFLAQRPEDLQEYYRLQRFRRWGMPPPPMIKFYPKIQSPHLQTQGTATEEGLGLLYSIPWSCLIVDEIQLYTNIGSKRCMGLGSIYSERRWGLSGTMFTEPVAERVLGFLFILGLGKETMCLPDVRKMLTRRCFRGLSQYIVECPKIKFAKEGQELHYNIVSHGLTQTEQNLYLSYRDIIASVHKAAERFRQQHDTENARIFGSYLLAMITYLRQLLVCPIIPMTSSAIDFYDVKKKSILSKIMMDEIEKIDGMKDYLSNPNSLVSSRYRKAFEILGNTKSRTVVFFSFRTCLDVFHALATKDGYVDAKRNVYVIAASHNATKRGSILEEFAKDDTGILLLTYDLGAEGLNLQCANQIIIMSYWWNSGKTKQSIGRLWRNGQKDDVHAYLLTSNTGIENAILEKQWSKQNMCKQMMKGSLRDMNIAKIKMNDILYILENENGNVEIVEDTYLN